MQNSKNRITKVATGAFIVLLMASLFISMYYNSTMQNEINHRDILIDKLLWSDSTLNKIMEIEYDSLTGTRSYTYRTYNGKPVKYNQLSRELDSIVIEVVNYIEKYSSQVNETEQVIDDYNHLVDRYNTLVTEFNNLNSNNTALKNKLESTTTKYNNLVDKYNIHNEQLMKLQDSIAVHQRIINLITKNYSIKYNIKYNNEYRIISIESPKLDSALMIYPLYKHKLTYNSQDSCWYIKGGKE